MKSPSGEMPQYLMIKAQLQARIQNGALKSGDKLPSERELCALFNTTRITVRESLAQLEASGVIYRADRRGWFVTPERLWLDPTQNTNFHKLCLEQGREPKTVLLDGRLAAVPLDVMAPLALQPFDQVYLLTRLRYADGRPVCYCENHCLPARVPELLRHDLNGSLTEIYQTHYDKELGTQQRQQVRLTCSTFKEFTTQYADTDSSTDSSQTHHQTRSDE